MKKPEVAIVGHEGLVAQRHKKAWEKLGIEWHPLDFDDALRDKTIDIVDICTPIWLHPPMILEAIAKRKKVICEKPLGKNVENAKAILAGTYLNQNDICIIYQFRFNPKILQLKQELADEKYGEIKLVTVNYRRWKAGEYFKGWRASKTEAGGGVVLNVTIHYLDLMQHLFGMPVDISGHITTMEKGIDVEDTAVASMKFPNGAVGSYVVSTHVKEPEYHMEMGIYGTKGHTIIELKENEYHAENFQAFLDGKDYVTPTEALKSLQLCEAIYNSN